MSNVHLIIPDSHAHPDYHNKRYELLGHLINDIKPDVVVDIGDWWDMPSLCSYDKGTKGFEGRRYRRDLDAGIDAMDRLRTIVRRSKRKLPRFVRVLGNHEHRIQRAVERDAILDGTVSINDLQSEDYGWETYPYLEPVEVDGVTYQHHFTSGVMGRPIGGEHPAYSILSKYHQSATQGHTHTFDYCVRTRANGSKIHGLVCGVFQDYDAEYAGPANKLWAPGVVVKYNVSDGDYDIERISLKRLEAAYAGR